MRRPDPCARCTRRRVRIANAWRAKCSECRRAWSTFQRARGVLVALGYRAWFWNDDRAPALLGRAWLYHSEADGSLRIIERDKQGRILAVRQWAT